MQKNRKPIQIAALRFAKYSEAEADKGSIATEIIALCDDGTIWTMFGTDSEWVPLPPIPQDQLREVWLAEVGEHLVNKHLVRKEAITQILDDYRDDLRKAFNEHEPTKESAKVINDKIQKRALEIHA